MAVLTITADNFEKEVLQANKPVLIDFWASWCGPCRMFSPTIDEIATEYADEVIVGKVNVDEENSLAQQFQVASIPTLILFKEGKAAKSSLGVIAKEDVIAMFR